MTALKAMMGTRGRSPAGGNARALAAAIVWAVAMPVTFGDPPPWAPAHGLRVKQDPYYLGYSGRKWDSDYGVLDGHCNQQAVGAVLGATGAAIGSQSVKSENRPVATVLGGILAAAAGSKVSRDMDERDRACLGQTLELAGAERGVTWTNPERGVSYRVIPLGGFTDNGQSCREFVTFFAVGRTEATVRHRACSGGDGVWQVIG